MIVRLTMGRQSGWQVMAGLLAVAMLLAAVDVQAQAPSAPPGQPPVTSRSAPPDDASPASTPPSAGARGPETIATNPFQPGLLHELGRMLEDSVNKLNSDLRNTGAALENLNKQTNQAVKGAADAAKDAADLTAGAAGNIVAFPTTRVVTGRSKCEAAPNGAPDCRVAANALCRSKGFGQGTSLDVESAEKCPVQTWLSGRPRKPGECGVETFVTRASCR